jgi:aspartyl-tRNA(Asn)/glutamyl-tRNA(Gln) amidotransferase subunit C
MSVPFVSPFDRSATAVFQLAPVSAGRRVRFAQRKARRGLQSPIDDPRADRRTMIDREQVLHVARLARLRLGGEEVERMSSELSTILDHIEKIGELDLDDVEPTSHVIELENVLREDDPRESLPRERALEGAPDAAEGGFRVPSPGA